MTRTAPTTQRREGHRRVPQPTELTSNVTRVGEERQPKTLDEVRAILGRPDETVTVAVLSELQLASRLLR